ncbi:MAG TPA: hypothetical protein VNW97_17205 [Candidatus Saccharimonadales bacterium]|nr:hypothetical protein [Candidatus Saccharimonadales bacterium]
MPDWKKLAGPAAAVTSGVTVLAFVIEILKKGITSVGAIDWLLRQGVHADAKGEIHAAMWLELIIAANFCLMIIACAVWSTSTRKPSSTRAVLKTLEGMISSVYQIHKQAMPLDGQHFNEFKSIKSRYLIGKDFTATVTRVYQISALERGIHFWEVNIFAEPEAPAMDYLSDIDFNVKDISEHAKFEVAFLPFVNQPRQKKVMIYFLPILDPKEAQPRTISISYRWRGYFRCLERKLEEIQSFGMQARHDIGLMEFEVYLEPGTGKNLICSRAGSLDGIQTPPAHAEYQPEDKSPKWPGWRYEIKNGPPADYALKLNLHES